MANHGTKNDIERYLELLQQIANKKIKSITMPNIQIMTSRFVLNIRLWKTRTFDCSYLYVKTFWVSLSAGNLFHSSLPGNTKCCPLSGRLKLCACALPLFFCPLVLILSSVLLTVQQAVSATTSKWGLLSWSSSAIVATLVSNTSFFIRPQLLVRSSSIPNWISNYLTSISRPCVVEELDCLVSFMLFNVSRP